MIAMVAKSMIIYISMIAMVTRVMTGRGEGVMGAVSSNVSGRNARMGGATYSTSRTYTHARKYNTHMLNTHAHKSTQTLQSVIIL